MALPLTSIADKDEINFFHRYVWRNVVEIESIALHTDIEQVYNDKENYSYIYSGVFGWV